MKYIHAQNNYFECYVEHDRIYENVKWKINAAKPKKKKKSKKKEEKKQHNSQILTTWKIQFTDMYMCYLCSIVSDRRCYLFGSAIPVARVARAHVHFILNEYKWLFASRTHPFHPNSLFGWKEEKKIQKWYPQFP